MREGCEKEVVGADGEVREFSEVSEFREVREEVLNP